jgi:hypothetical protein
MHPKVFVKLKKTLKPSRPGKKTPKNPKKPKKTQKNPKKTQKNPLGWVFKKKTGFFPTLAWLDPDPVLDRHQNRSQFRIRVDINTMAIHNTRMYYFQILGDHCDEVWYCKVSSNYS